MRAKLANKTDIEFRYKNHKDWAKHMKRLIDNPNMIQDLGERLYETVRYKYDLNNVTKDRAEFYKSIIK